MSSWGFALIRGLTAAGIILYAADGSGKGYTDRLLPFTLWTDLGLPNNSFVEMHRKSSTLEQVGPLTLCKVVYLDLL